MNFNIYKNIKKQGDLVFLCLILFFGLALNKIPVIEGFRRSSSSRSSSRSSSSFSSRSSSNSNTRSNTSSNTRSNTSSNTRSISSSSYRRFPSTYYIIYYNDPMYTTGHRRSWSRQRKYNDIKSKMENDPELIANKDIHGWTYDKVIGAPYDRTSLRYQYRKGTELLQGNTVGDILTDIKVKEKIEPEVRSPDSKKPVLSRTQSIILLISIIIGIIFFMPPIFLIIWWFILAYWFRNPPETDDGEVGPLKYGFRYWAFIFAIPIKIFQSRPRFSRPNISRPSFDFDFVDNIVEWFEDHPKIAMMIIFILLTTSITIPIVLANNKCPKK